MFRIMSGFRLFCPIFNAFNLLIIPLVLVISVKSTLVFTRIIHFTSKAYLTQSMTIN